MDDTAWIRAEMLVPIAQTDSHVLWELGALGVEVQDRDTFMEDAPFAPLPDGMNRLIAFFDQGEEAVEALAQTIVDRLQGAQIVAIAPYNDRSWETAWMRFFRPVRLSRRVVAGPPWEELETPEDGMTITIEPGMAFGTGTHETTQLCAAMLDELLDARTSPTVLDVGCGSAILAMLASGLGAGHVVGVDVDATAVEVAKDNLRANGFSDEQIALSTTPLARVEGDFDIVVANILAHILLGMRDALLSHVAPGGDLLLSGIPDFERDRLIEAFSEPGFTLIEHRQRGEWVALHLRREG
ncbi:50S ribosomal protein L11 methyltransferase [Lujinxingia vulgaris]|uniref:Ribosomal protein L11 methyltransferase n=1 Tax=Lujinxingia vulgaris TaxID=2600176 RepID=A0A5C6X965_9DELT|nr:50S ribosomal protein L11 methyltransferase [Lujinxingia vulgaris]TXD38361.1 50S ribosomal protein L11 methyltransferase [Lujinxingia vulgaris]